MCILGDGTKCNIEVQKSDDDNHLKRARYNAACITASATNTRTKFENVPSVYVVYITDFDFIGENRTIYHVQMTCRETGSVLDDRLNEIFVNTAVNDNTDISELMVYFKEKASR